MQLAVLYEDNHLLIVRKPAGLATMGAVQGQLSLLELAKRYVKHKYRKPGNVYLGVVHRLDRPVSGVVALARTSKAAARLSKAFQTREVEKEYWLLVPAGLTPLQGTLIDWLRKNESRQRMETCAPETPGARQAILHYHTLDRRKDLTALSVTLETGRKHQIRVQFADRHRPILGDRKYGSHRPFPVGIALHATRLTLKHPVRDTCIDVRAPLPAYWPWKIPVSPS